METPIATQVETRVPPPKPYPWLVYIHGEYQTFHDIKNNNSVCRKSIPELRDSRVYGSWYGWSLLSRDEKLFILWNPLTRKTIELPELERKRNVSHDDIACSTKFDIICCMSHELHGFLSSPPDHEDSMVMILDNYKPIVYFCAVRNGTWRMQKFDKLIEEPETTVMLLQPFKCDGKLYVLSSPQRKLLQIEHKNRNELIMSCLDVEPPDQYSYIMSDCLESDGELFMVDWLHGGLETKNIIGIHVWKLDFGKKQWVRVKDIGDRVFFIDSDYTAYSCPSTRQIKSNQIYFTQLEDKSLYCFNVEDGTVTSYNPCSDLPSTCEPFLMKPEFKELTTDVNDKEDEQIKIEETFGYDGTSLVDKLPLGMLTEISKRLVLFDYLNYLTLCRDCKLYAAPVQWRDYLAKMEGDTTLCPWLMSVHPEEKGVYSFIDPWHGNRRKKFLMHTPDELKGESCAEVCHSKDGWSLVLLPSSRHPSSLYLWNPFTKEKRFVGNCGNVIPRRIFGFSSLPTSHNCLVAGITGYGKKFFSISYFLLGTETEQDEFAVEYNLPFVPSHCSQAVFFGDSFYFLGEEGNLAILTIPEQEDFLLCEVLEKPERPHCKPFQQNFLLEWNGSLCSVCVGFMGEFVRIFWLDFSQMAWVEVDDLLNYAIFMSHFSSFATVPKVPDMGNKIYFPRFYNDSIVFYSVESKKFHTHNGDTFDNLYGTSEQLFYSWTNNNRWK